MVLIIVLVVLGWYWLSYSNVDASRRRSSISFRNVEHVRNYEGSYVWKLIPPPVDNLYNFVSLRIYLLHNSTRLVPEGVAFSNKFLRFLTISDILCTHMWILIFVVRSPAGICSNSLAVSFLNRL